MKRIGCLAMFIMLTTFTFGQTLNGIEYFKKLSWLSGTWNRTNVKPGQSGLEKWEQTSVFELRGLGISLQGQDTTFVEKLRIVTKDNTIVYVADVPENQKPVYFKLIHITDTSFVCENPDHDFPKKITYQLDGKILKAQVSGDGKAIDFLFERK